MEALYDRAVAHGELVDTVRWLGASGGVQTQLVDQAVVGYSQLVPHAALRLDGGVRVVRHRREGCQLVGCAGDGPVGVASGECKSCGDRNQKRPERVSARHFHHEPIVPAEPSR